LKCSRKVHRKRRMQRRLEGSH